MAVESRSPFFICRGRLPCVVIIVLLMVMILNLVTAVPFIPNAVPVVLIIAGKMGFILLFLLTVRNGTSDRSFSVRKNENTAKPLMRDIVTIGGGTAVLTIVPVLGIVESAFYYPYFFQMNGFQALFFITALLEPLLVVAASLLYFRYWSLFTVLPSTALVLMLFERLRDEPPWLPVLTILTGTLFVSLVYFVFRYLGERIVALDRLKQVEELNRQASAAAAEIGRYRQREILTQLGGSVAHEINNPANYAMGNLILLRDRFIDETPETVVENRSDSNLVELIESAIAGIDTIIEVTKRFRETFGGTKDKPAPINLYKVAGSVVAILDPTGNTVLIDIPTPLEIVAHPVDVYILLANLVRNALDAIGDEGEVLLSAQELGGETEIVVEDDGQPVPEAIRNRIFEPFVSGRADSSGIGLALCHAIVERSGGSIRLDDTSDRKKRFIVTLPNGEKGLV